MSVTLLCFGRRGYAIAAANLVLSLRHHGYAGPIRLHATADMERMLDGRTMQECDVLRLSDHLAADPGLCKVMLPNLVEDAETLYLDVDGIAVRDITPLIERLSRDPRAFVCQAWGRHELGSEARPPGHWWVPPAKMQERHCLPDGRIIWALNTSAIWMRRGEGLARLQLLAERARSRYSQRDLVHKWGGMMPDELCWSAACAIEDIDPSAPEQICYFDRKSLSAADIAEVAYILPMYGSNRDTSSTSSHKRELYDGLVRSMRGRIGAGAYGARHVMLHKFIN